MAEPVALPGCTPVPLASYLKAVGIHRLIVEQGADRDALGYWKNEIFYIDTRLSENEIEEFFLTAYRPTPVIAPWNGGSGFYPKDNKSGIDPLAESGADRFSSLSGVIHITRQLLARQGWEERPEGEAKAALLAQLRARLPDAALDWLDAAVVLTGDQTRYPPLLGTGGNDGRLDFTNNFLQRLVDLFDPADGRPRVGAGPLLSSALYGTPAAGLSSAAVGQFAPGAAGGPNATSGFEGDSLINPWDFILMLEGAMLFASAATRRLEAERGSASFPFTVITTGSGAGGVAIVDEGNARAEMWMPLWETPATLTELRALLGEGRAALGRRTARDGLDFARAVAKMGVDRGITSFQRYAFMMRSGKAYLATPLSRVPVKRNPDADLIDRLEQNGWLSRFRKLARTTGRAGTLGRQLEDTLFDIAQSSRKESGERGAITTSGVQRALILLGKIQRYLASSPQLQEACSPVPLLSPDWVRAADDGSEEFRIALAIASLRSEALPADSFTLEGTSRVATLSMSPHVAPVHPTDASRWFPRSRLVTWGEGSLLDNLEHTLLRRMQEAERLGFADKPLLSSVTADLPAIFALLSGATDDARINDLVRGLVLCRIPSGPGYRPGRVDAPLPLPYVILKPLFVPDAILRDASVGALAATVRLPLIPSVPRLLAAGRLGDAVREGWRRRRGSGVPTPPIDQFDYHLDSRRLLAALAVPVAPHDVRRLLDESGALMRGNRDITP